MAQRAWPPKTQPRKRQSSESKGCGIQIVAPILSVRLAGGQAVRRPVSRVLCPAYMMQGGDDHSSSAGCCQPPQATYPDIGAGSHQPHAACVPTWPCSGWGLPCPACCQPGGALLPHLFTLTCVCPVGRAGGLFSAALSLGSPPPGVTRHPDPVEPGLSSPRTARARAAAVRPSDSGWSIGSAGSSVKHPWSRPVPTEFLTR